MSVTFEKVIDGISRYIDAEIYSTMNDWQEIIARLVVGRYLTNSDQLKSILLNNGFIRTFGVINSDGTVNIDELLTDLKREISNKGKLNINIPMFGKLSFEPCDVDRLRTYIQTDNH